ncbi:MAG: RsmE family RNA methyltransferase [Syntrophorhabdaceae bacterium]|nr:16S rRNA (uracil(1498)-N(3))-methyltransferase [Syntrophorhabdaceae bacterium]MDD4195980.1 RsmE family RNA methyltransferase [Syntrophorhabdaceae bacterium]HOC47035.1 RsmE family RNA methyltransferase [Syntrophorhabdaceae bacterium]
MEIRRVFVDKLKIKNGMVLLAGPAYKYIVGVLRKGPGDRVDIIDGKGYLYRSTIQNIKGKELFLQVLDVVHKPQEKRPRVILCVSPIKGPRMDWLIEKATELGTEKIVPTIFRRTLIRFNAEGSEKVERWRRITVEASRQSGRFTIPEVTEPTPLRGIASLIEEDVGKRIVLYEKERHTTLKDVFGTNTGDAICIVIGPEGGIEEPEVTWLKENGFTACTLGENIFRAETTPLVVLSVVLYESART